ncbi:MAG: right-handed parallel beta-helix repeat-containing protein, partial [Thermogutta sp.]
GECAIVATPKDLPQSSPNRGEYDTSSHKQFVAPKVGDPQQIVVDRNGGGQATTLEEALAACEEGATIVLNAGTHRLDRPLKIIQSVKLVGAGKEKTRLVCEGQGFVLQFRGDGTFSAEGISFEHFGNQPANVVEIKSGHGNLSGCRFRGGIDKRDSWTAGTGLWIDGNAEVRVFGCEAVQNQRCGIVIGGTATATVEENLCEDNQGGGIGWSGSASGTARRNVCRHNGYQGIDVEGSAAPTLGGNVCEQNERCGILYWQDGMGTASNNTCRGNGLHGIGVQGFAVPTLEANTCEQNRESGIYYWENSSGEARNNLCRHNRQHGIGVAGLAAPTLERNKCEDNAEYGIFYSEKASGTACENVLRSNKAGAI